MVELTDVTLRDGIQMEKRVLSVEEKLALFERLSGCGYPRLEISSFVSPKWVPQFEGADAFVKAVTGGRSGRAELMAFVPNEKGLERLLAFPIPWGSAFVAATETFNRKNVNQAIGETLAGLGAVVKRAHEAKRRVRIYVSTVFGCPYEGPVTPEAALATLKKVAALGPDEIALSDTIGVALPVAVDAMVRAFRKEFPVERLALHLHNTYGLALGNALAGAAAGVTRFDGSTGGIGGCPYAKGATGNVATEDLALVLYRQGVGAPPDWAKVREAVGWLRAAGLPIHSRVGEIFEKGGAVYGIG